MSKEVRCIMFTSEEIHVALEDALWRRNPKSRPSIRSAELFEQDGAVKARVTRSDDDGTEQVVLDPNEVMGAVLMFCRTRRLPLSNRSMKKIELAEGRLVLVMSMNLEFVRPAVVSGAVVYAPAADKEFVTASHHAKRFAASH
jgi:hypothetical protein